MGSIWWMIYGTIFKIFLAFLNALDLDPFDTLDSFQSPTLPNRSRFDLVFVEYIHTESPQNLILRGLFMKFKIFSRGSILLPILSLA